MLVEENVLGQKKTTGKVEENVYLEEVSKLNFWRFLLLSADFHFDESL